MKKKIYTFFLFSALLGAKELYLFFDSDKEIPQRELYNAIGVYEPYFYEFYIDEPMIDLKELPLIKEALKNYYKARGFYHAEISDIKDKNSLTIIIKENNPLIIKSLNSVSDLDVSKKIPFKEGDRFDADKFAQSKKDIKLLYANNHFCNVSLDAKAWIDIENDYAYLTYDVRKNDLCRFGKIEAKETKNIDAEILKSMLFIQEGDLFSTNSITKSYESLYGCEGISKAIINTNVDSSGKKVDVVLSVFENEKPIRTQVGAGFSSDEGAMFLLGVKDRNFISNLKMLGVETRVTQVKQSIKTNFDMPLLNRNSTGFVIGYENEQFEAFKEERLSSELFLKQNFLPHTFKETLAFDSSKTYNSDDETLFPKNSLFIISPKLEWNYDVRDKILEASEGYFVNAEISGSIKSALSDASYYKFRAKSGYILPIDDYILGLRATFGTLGVGDGHIPASYRFFAGGMHSNRAYGYRKLGPTDAKNDPSGSDSILEATAELRFDIYGNLRGVLFSDNTYLGNGSIPSYDNGYYSAGFGLRYKTPLGPISIDLGFDTGDPLKQYAIHFHIGELF